MRMRVLHLLSQRPGRTGSGVTLSALTRSATLAGLEQRAIVGVPVDDPQPVVEGLSPEHVWPVRFGEGGDVPFQLPGMSDVMPYATRRFASLSPTEIDLYLDTFRARVREAVERFRPDVVHAHHLWLAASTVKDAAPDVPVVSHCHATGLRQMMLCPSLAARVRSRLARHEAFVVLHDGHRDQLVAELGVDERRVHVVGAGYDAAVFRPMPGVARRQNRVVYVGKLARAKGVPQLLDAFERLRELVPDAELHLAAGGDSEEADGIRRRIEQAPFATLYGLMPHNELARLLCSARAFVLPSFYEGLPLALIEAAACGCRVVATALAGVAQLAPALGETAILVPRPALIGVDTPSPTAVPAFVAKLTAALDRALMEAPPPPAATGAFTWDGVFARVASVWRMVATRPT